jgi:hypothetical protein
MARPSKKGLDYFPLDVNIFENEKVAAISGEFQIKGEITLIKLLCAIYRNGYYYEWSEMNRAHLLRQLPGISPGLLDQVIDRLVKWGFFDKSLFDSSKILTSSSIQERYFAAIARRKTNITGYPYLLINVCNNAVNVCNNSVQAAFMSTESTQSKVNKIKTPLNLPTRRSINHGFSSEGENFSKAEKEENYTPPRMPAFNDGKKRNYDLLLDFLKEYNFTPAMQAQIIVLSNYGEIGHPVWKLIYEVRNNSKIKMPREFVISRLRNIMATE